MKKRTKKDDQTILIVAAIGIAAYFLLKKKKPRYILEVDASTHAGFLAPGIKAAQTEQKASLNKYTPFVDREQYFKDQYNQSLNACSY